MDDASGRTLLELAESTRTPTYVLLNVLREEIAAGRVEVVRNGSAVYRLTPAGRRELEPILSGVASLSAIREPK